MNLNKLVGTKQKIYYPWEQKSIERVVREDHQGFYIFYKSKKVRLAPMQSGMKTDIVGFKALHGTEV